MSGESFYRSFPFRKLTDVLKGNGGLADVRYLKQFLMENLGDLTLLKPTKNPDYTLTLLWRHMMQHKMPGL